MSNTEEVNQEKTKKGLSRNRIITMAVIVAFLIIGFVGGTKYLKAKEAEEYKENMAETAIIMYESWGEINSILEGYEMVWDLAIESGIDDWSSYVTELVDEMNKNNGEGTKIDRNKLEDNIGKLSNPPEKYKESYKILKEQYRIYVKGYEQMKEPTGSLDDFQNKTNDFSQEFNSLKADFKTTFENGEMRDYIEDGVEKLNQDKKDKESGVDDITEGEGEES